MDVREKLVELIGSTKYGNGSLVRNNFQKGFIEKIATHLVDNGVTVQEWISVNDRLPEPWEQVLIYSRHDFCESAFYIGVPGKWCSTWNHEMLDADSVTYWMSMPQPPKGE